MSPYFQFENVKGISMTSLLTQPCCTKSELEQTIGWLVKCIKPVLCSTLFTACHRVARHIFNMTQQLTFFKTSLAFISLTVQPWSGGTHYYFYSN